MVSSCSVVGRVERREGGIPGGGKAPEEVFREECFSHDSQLSFSSRVRRVLDILRALLGDYGSLGKDVEIVFQRSISGGRGL